MELTKEQATKLLTVLNDHLYGNDEWYDICVNLDIVDYSMELEQKRMNKDRKYNPDKHGEACDDYPVLAEIFEALGIKVDIELKAPTGYYKGWD